MEITRDEQTHLATLLQANTKLLARLTLIIVVGIVVTASLVVWYGQRVGGDISLQRENDRLQQEQEHAQAMLDKAARLIPQIRTQLLADPAANAEALERLRQLEAILHRMANPEGAGVSP